MSVMGQEASFSDLPRGLGQERDVEVGLGHVLAGAGCRESQQFTVRPVFLCHARGGEQGARRDSSHEQEKVGKPHGWCTHKEVVPTKRR